LVLVALQTLACRRFEKIVRFSTIGPVKAGWMVKSYSEPVGQGSQ
jgi:hypothetical protein